MAKSKKNVSPNRFILSLAVACSIALILLVSRIMVSDSTRYIFLIWNLILSSLSPLLAWWLVRRVRQYGWLRIQQIILTLVWLSFLPNSFYIITDFIHLRATYEASFLFDIIVLTSFTLNGLIFGYISVFIVHKELVKRMRLRHTWYIVAGIFAVSSFAIYLGRFTRWNTWDILLKPAGLLFDVSDRVVNPAAHSETYITTLTFFLVLFSVYWVIWESAELMRSK